MGTMTLCIVAMPTDRAVELAARIADAEDPACEELLHCEGPQVCDALRCEVLHQADEIERLRAIIEGRTTPPTPAELDAHASAGGSWLLVMSYADSYRRRWKRRIETMTLCDFPRDPVAEKVRPRCALATDHARVHEGGVGPDYREWRWWALDSHGRPCAWPVVEVSR